MISKNRYILVLSISMLGLILFLSNWASPYSETLGLSLSLVAGYLAKKYNLRYESVIKRKEETRIAGYISVICGVLILGFYPNAWPTQKIASGLFVIIGTMLVGITLKNDRWQKL